MSKIKTKETTLIINFVNSDNSISDKENMSKVMELLGAPDFAYTYYFGTYNNIAFINETLFDIGKDGNPYSVVGSIYSDSMEITTRGDHVTKTALDNLHKKNVLAVKDKIVSMKHVQNVEYTCRLKDVVSSECSV